MSASVTYGEYLGLPAILGAQAPRSGNHDEMLFIVIHQTSELWMKLCLHELDAARADIAGDNLGAAFKALARVGRIQSNLTQSWEILATMTPADYAQIRHALGTSSGFQSHQYRLVEFALGAKSAVHVARHVDDAPVYALLTEALHAPSLYDEAVRLLARRGFALPQAVLQRDFSAAYASSTDVEAAWLSIYRDTARYWDLYELAEKLVDLEYRLQQWRFAHLKTVERIIGNKLGTGGTAGVPYLEAVLKQRFFPELLAVRTAI